MGIIGDIVEEGKRRVSDIRGAGSDIASDLFSFTSASYISGKIESYIEDLLKPDYATRKNPTRAPLTPRRVIYGRARVGGQYALIETSGDKDIDLNVIYIFASHACEDVEEVWLGDAMVRGNSDLNTSTDSKYTDKLTTIASFDGLGNVPAAVSAAFPSFKSEYRFEGLSYLFCQFKYDAEIYQGIPSVSVVVKGKNDILDTRTSLTGYTANAALCELDWLLNFMGATTSEINSPSWNDAADDCDTLVAAKDTDGNDTTEPRFELNGTISLSGPKLDSLGRMMQNGGVIPSYEQGEWSAVIQKFTTPLAILNEDDLISKIQVNTGADKQDKINTAKGSFISPENSYEQIEYPIIESPTALTDDLEILERTIDYTLVGSASQCRRLSKITVEKSRFGLTVSALFKFNVLEYPVGSRIQFDYSRFDWTDRVFRIVSRNIDSISGVGLTLIADNEDIYSWNEGDALAVFVPPTLTLPDADVVLVPESLTAIQELYIANTSKAVKARVVFTWVPGDTSAINFEVEGSFEGAEFRIFSDYIVGDTFAVDDLEIGSWIFRVRGVNGIGAKSPYLSLNTTIVGKTAAPQDVTGFTETIKPFIIELSWDAVPDLDIAEYEIRLGDTWETAETLQVINALKWDWETRPTGNETLLIKAIDTTSNESTNAAEATVSIQNPSTVEPLVVSVIDNNVQLTWADATTSFNIDLYEVRRGDTFSSATVIGFTDGTFQPVLEVVGGVFTYWVRAIDVQGNVGTETSVIANVDSPPDFILQSNQLLDLSEGTAINLLAEVGAGVTADTTIFTADTTSITADNDGTFVLVGPADTTETWEEHFESIIAAGSFPVPVTADNAILKADSTLFTADSSDPSIRQLQTDNGFPYYLQPTPTTASYEQVTDFGGTFQLSRIQLTPDITTIAGDPDVVFTIGYSDDDINYTEVVGLEITGIDFQFVRVKIDITSASNVDLLRINSLRLRLDVKLKTDAGNGTASASGGTQVDFNLEFVDVSSIQVTASGTSAVTAVYDFVDIPNPTDFDVYLFDSSGTQIAGDFSWNVRGV